MKKMIIALLISASLMTGCNSQPQPVIVQQAAPAQVEYAQPNDNRMLEGAIVGAAATALIMGNGHHYDGYHWYGPAPYGYVSYGGRLYRDTPYVRSYSRTHQTTVINKTVINNNAPAAPTAKTTAAPATTPATPAVQPKASFANKAPVAAPVKTAPSFAQKASAPAPTKSSFSSSTPSRSSSSGSSFSSRSGKR
jgi:hypothetical protein